MTIVAFLIDTSASMNQKCPTGTTLLDVAKTAIESFIKARARDTTPRFRPDRYFLFTYSPELDGVRVSWGVEKFSIFMGELKNLRAYDLSTPGQALRNTFDILNMHRFNLNLDTYGQGRTPWFVDPMVVIHLTDGGALAMSSGISEQLIIPKPDESQPWKGITPDIHRWDQRLFTFLLRMPATGGNYIPPVQKIDQVYASMSEQTCGKSHVVNSVKALNQHMESLAAKIKPAIAVIFEPVEPIEATDDMNGMPSNNCRLLNLKPQPKGQFTGNWPIPEPYWTGGLSTLPSRPAIPVISFSKKETDAHLLDAILFDKYEVEPCPLTQYIIAQKRVNVCWQVFVKDSALTPGLGKPFGYLRLSPDAPIVNLILLPYDYQTLFHLYTTLNKIHRMQPPRQWHADFEQYLQSVPPYYIQPLRNAFRRISPAMGALVPDQMDNFHKPAFTQWLTRLRTLAKIDVEKITQQLSSRQLFDDDYNSKSHASITTPPVRENEYYFITSSTLIKIRNPRQRAIWILSTDLGTVSTTVDEGLYINTISEIARLKAPRFLRQSRSSIPKSI